MKLTSEKKHQCLRYLYLNLVHLYEKRKFGRTHGYDMYIDDAPDLGREGVQLSLIITGAHDRK